MTADEFGDAELNVELKELSAEGFVCGSWTVDVSVRWYNRSVDAQPKIPVTANKRAK